MGVCYCLINSTKREYISFGHLPVGTAREIAGNPVSASVVCWYLLQNGQDDIHFVPDQYPAHQFDAQWQSVLEYTDVTDRVIVELIASGILSDDGIETLDKDEPEIFTRKLRNIWCE